VREFAGVDLAALRAENELLKRQAAEQKAVAPKTATEEQPTTELNQARAQLAALQSERDLLRLEKSALENQLAQTAAAPPPAVVPASLTATPDRAEAARIQTLEAERDELQAKLNSANKALASNKSRKSSARVRELEKELTSFRARVEVLEAKPVPYTAQELALFRSPAPKVATNTAAVAASVKSLPPETAALIGEAHRYFSTRQFDKAEDAYRRALSLDDHNGPALTEMAVVQIQLDKLNDAEQSVRTALAVTPESAYGLATLGHVKFRQGKTDDAFEALSRAAQLDPNNAEIQNLLGLVLNQKGLRAPAETALRKALQLDPGNRDAHHNLAVIYAAQNPPALELARWHYQKALAAGMSKNPDLEKVLNAPKSN
jgi:Flp pilus assembly protein TadD